MTLTQYIQYLQISADEHGGDLQVVYSCDDEGNSFDSIHFTPTIGKYDNRQFTDTEDKPNAVCVN